MQPFNNHINAGEGLFAGLFAVCAAGFSHLLGTVPVGAMFGPWVPVFQLIAALFGIVVAVLSIRLLIKQNRHFDRQEIIDKQIIERNKYQSTVDSPLSTKNDKVIDI